jgi:hypothetical protein
MQADLRLKLNVFCLDWHIDRSTACQHLVVDPLEAFCDVELVAWDGAALPSAADDAAAPLIFFQLPPPDSLVESNASRVVWIPMWDQARGYGQDWWDAIPKSVRIVSFSEQIRVRAETAGLTVLNLRYFSDPSALASVTWDQGPVVFYWNRTGIARPSFLRKLCKAIRAKELIFRPDLDPRVDPGAHYELPKRLGRTKVTTVSASSQDEYLSATRSANVFLAPRVAEGVGLTFLEAMARGCAVIAYDAPTMNEYIRHDQNGILLDTEHAITHALSDRQDWKRIGSADLEALGTQAKADHEQGHVQWQKSVAAYASFVIDW